MVERLGGREEGAAEAPRGVFDRLQKAAGRLRQRRQSRHGDELLNTAALSTEPRFSSERSNDSVRLRLDGDWTIEASRAIESGADKLVAAGGEAKRAVFDFSRIGRMDT